MNTAKKNILLEIPYFPCLQFFSKWFVHEQIVLEQHESYRKGSYRNRCHIGSANGLHRLSIPLQKGKNQRQNIRAVAISYDTPWQSQHWTAIRSAYGNAPFFEFYEEDLHPFFEKKWEFLFDYNQAILETLIELIGLEEKISLNTSFEKEVAADTLDFRNKISPKSSNLHIDTQFETIPYTQVFQEKLGFIPNLSILDLIFCKGPEAVLVLEEMAEGRND